MQAQQLINELNKIAIKAKEIDKQRGENPSPLFDKTLFSCLSKQLLPCVVEAQNNLALLLNQKDNSLLAAKKVTHLSEKLLAQISALHREISTQELRKQENGHKAKIKAAASSLYQDLAQHQEWERRLSNMVKEAEQRLVFCEEPNQRQKIQHYLLASEKRLSKCIQARKQIEIQIKNKAHKG